MIDWDSIERSLVADYAARVHALRQRFEAEARSLADRDLARVEAAISAAFGVVGSAPRAAAKPAQESAAPPEPAPNPWEDTPVRPSSGDSARSRVSEPVPVSAQTAPAPPAPEPLPEPAPGDPVLAGLKVVRAALDRGGLSLPEEIAGFLDVAESRFAALQPDEQAGEKGTRFLTECVKRLDALDVDLAALDAEGAVREALSRARARVMQACGARDCVFFPSETTSVEDARRRFGDGAVEVANVPSKRPCGSLVAVLEHGLVIAGKPRRRARVLVASSLENPLSTLYLETRAALARLPRSVPAPARIEAARTLERLAVEAIEPLGDDARATSLRYAVNALVPLAEGALMGPILRPIRDALRALGVYEIEVRVGDRFDESFTPDRFERRSVPSDRLAGTISKILQPGFVNRSGICIQRALLGVSAGSGRS